MKTLTELLPAPAAYELAIMAGLLVLTTVFLSTAWRDWRSYRVSGEKWDIKWACSSLLGGVLFLSVALFLVFRAGWTVAAALIALAALVYSVMNQGMFDQRTGKQ